MIKTIEYRHNNRIKKIQRDVTLHIELVWLLVSRFYSINHKVINPDVILDNVVNTY